MLRSELVKLLQSMPDVEVLVLDTENGSFDSMTSEMVNISINDTNILIG